MKGFINQTVNQHFISQAEQRLNAINPNVKPHKQKIYSFQIIDREMFKIQLESENGRLIKNNLSFLDLYSFDVDESSKELRFSFESLFNEYESKIIAYTQTLLDKVNNRDSNILHEVFNIFILKILNSFRNPFCIQKTINTLLPIIKYSPLDKELAPIYKKITDGNKPHYNYLCDFFCVNKGEYELWLKGLFMLLMKVEVNGEKTNVLESMARGLYEDKNNYKMIMECHYDNSYSVLLSDRGFNSIDDNEHCITEFNLNDTAFITYSFTDLNLLAYSKGWVSDYQKKLIDKIKEIQGNTVHVTYKKNDIDLLNNYNNRTIYQAYSHVFSAKKNWR